MKRNQTLLGLSIAAILTISVVAMSAMPIAIAKPAGNGQPDLVADLVAEGTNDAKGHAWFWFDNDDDPSELRYQIVLNKVDVGTEFNGEEKLKDKNDGKGLEYFVEKIHIHYAPDGEHMSEHFLNIVGPNDDNDLKIAGHTFSGVWDDDDATGHHGHASKGFTAKLDDVCNEDTDVNIHLSEHEEYIRGQILQNSDACENLG